MLRRELLLGAAGALATASCQKRAEWPRAIASLEGSGRLGVAVVDVGTGAVEGHRLDERFSMCSTFKLVLAAMVMTRAEQGKAVDLLDAPVPLTRADLVTYSPVVEPLFTPKDGPPRDVVTLTLADLAHAAQTTSDNTAANKLLAHYGGPAAFTAFCRENGDDVTRLDRVETEMNDVATGDERDTTTPRAYATLVARLLGGRGLGSTMRDSLLEWMIATETGKKRLRAGFPAEARAGDKTGTSVGAGYTGRLNDVAWVELPGRSPMVVAAYYDTMAERDDVLDTDQAVLAEVGRIVTR
ncbi:MAG: class A beta-lactamase [Polyangiaceae bacterium]